MVYKQSLSKTRTHKLTVVGGKSYSLVLPVEFVRELGWKERQKLDITLQGKTLVVKDWVR
ncbi:AbrB/MazE/SpoVT family DNA-binding domain-containing protein [Candidatus Kaiserbacteria bacterium]|nr:AbrB/MazE/SpoVT family DNA-binding domain-containing protein [Candidatus Kaiserbacteria bacterium]